MSGSRLFHTTTRSFRGPSPSLIARSTVSPPLLHNLGTQVAAAAASSSSAHLHTAPPPDHCEDAVRLGQEEGSGPLPRPISLFDPELNTSSAGVAGRPCIISEEVCLRVLSDCNSRSLGQGVCVHCPIIKLGLQDHTFLNNSLLSLYSKRHGLDQARNLFDGLCHRDVVSWTAIISAYVRVGRGEEAIQLFDEMVISGAVPNEYTLSCVLRSSSSPSSSGKFDFGTCTHARVIKQGFESNPVSGSALTDFYSKYDKLGEAFKVFAVIVDGDTVSWTTMISAFVQAQEWGRAMQLFSLMTERGVAPNEFTFTKLLTACGFLGLHCGELVHAHVILWGVELNLVVKTALVGMYSKCHMMGDALKVFNQTPESDVMLWTAMISGYIRILDFKEAITMFRDMETRGVSPTAFTYAGVLSICSTMPAPELGEQIHSRVMRVGLEHDASVGNALVDMYTKCFSNNLEQSILAFKGINSPNVVSWTVLIAALVRHQQNQEAFSAFTQMRAGGVRPNSFTLSIILKVCGGGSTNAEAPNHYAAEQLHAYVLKTESAAGTLLSDDDDVTVGNSLVDVYARLGKVDAAWKVFNTMRFRDVITYTSLARGLNQMGLHRMALGLIVRMLDEGVKTDGLSLPCFLSASAGLPAIEPGRQLHCYSIKSGLDSQVSISNGLVDVYGKCGSAEEARMVFTSIPEPNIVSWNGLISALSSNGLFSDALSAFDDMRLAGTRPDEVTFLLVLYACSHGGLPDLGLEYFNSMRESSYGVLPPLLDHYVCLVDLLGRAGRLEEAASVIETMPLRPDALIYKTLLASCRLRGNLALGECTARRAIELDPTDPAVYVLLSNMYDDAGKTDHGKEIRRMMREKGVRKRPGQSWIEIRNKVHLFVAGDASNPRIGDIHEKIEDLKAKMGTGSAEYSRSYTAADADAAAAAAAHHSEKLAVAFGLLNTPPSAPVRVIKNLRICNDCHTFMELTSGLVDREIIVRDGSRFHSFKNGICSCGGYW